MRWRESRAIRWLWPDKDARVETSGARYRPQPKKYDSIQNEIVRRVLRDVVLLTLLIALVPCTIYIVQSLAAGPHPEPQKSWGSTWAWMRRQRQADAEQWIFSLSATLLIPTLLFLMSHQPQGPSRTGVNPAQVRFVFLARVLALSLLSFSVASAWMAIPPTGETVKVITSAIGIIIAFLCTSAAVVLSEMVTSPRMKERQRFYEEDAQSRIEQLSERRKSEFSNTVACIIAIAWLILPLAIVVSSIVLAYGGTEDFFDQFSSLAVFLVLPSAASALLGLLINSLRRVDGGVALTVMGWAAIISVNLVIFLTIAISISRGFAIAWLAALTLGLIMAERRHGGLIDMAVLCFELGAQRFLRLH